MTDTATLTASPAQKGLAKKLYDRRQAEIARFAAEEKVRQARERIEPTPERLNKGDIALRPVRDGVGGVVSSRTYSKRLDIVQLGKFWVSPVQAAFEQFAADAAVLGIQSVTMNYDRSGGGASSHNRVGGVGEDPRRRQASDRHDYIMRKLHTFDATGGVSVVEILNFVLCHVESVRLKKVCPKTWSDVGRLFEPGYDDEASARSHARGHLGMLGRFMAGAYLEYYAMYGGRRRIEARTTREISP